MGQVLHGKVGPILTEMGNHAHGQSRQTKQPYAYTKHPLHFMGDCLHFLGK